MRQRGLRAATRDGDLGLAMAALKLRDGVRYRVARRFFIP
jgi:hypothetical protein